MSETKAFERLARRAEALIERLEARLPGPAPPVEWDVQIACRWHNGALHPIAHPHRIRLHDLLCMDDQKAEILRNTRQFVAGRPANNALLWGSRGIGKSSLVKALLNEFAGQGLRLIEVGKHDLADLVDIVEPLHARPERFLLYCDDLSFEADDPSYKSLKAILDGSLATAPENVLVYATSNRRHLMPEYMSENREARMVDEEIHLGEGTEEKISLSERFGLWLSFYPFDQDQYLDIVRHWLTVMQTPFEPWDVTRAEALRWALRRGSRSGRVAWQFARDRAGRIIS